MLQDICEIRIENWSLADLPEDPYCPPEHRFKVLLGEVYGHPRKSDGSRIQTSPIVQSKSSGTLVATESGHRYRLGAIDPGYREWLAREGYVYVDDEPIAFGKRAKKNGDYSP